MSSFLLIVQVDPNVGGVTALALSYDHTYVASGHASGHIQLFDVNSPKAPARFVPPTTLPEVASGRQEGHIYGSRIVSIGFVAGRHTAVVSADDSGLAFYHSLGKVLFVEASDTLRILGKYPDEVDPLYDSVTPGPSIQTPFRRRRIRKAHTILSMAPLPLGASAHPTDAYNLVALLTPVKLVVVGLKPSPKTWYRRHRDVDDGSPKSRFKGVLAWYPSAPPVGAPQETHANGKSRSQLPTGSHPMLVYGWGNTLNLVRVYESKMMQEVRNSKNGKVSRVEVGRIVFEEGKSWTVGGDTLAMQWLNSNVGSSAFFYCVIFTSAHAHDSKSLSSRRPHLRFMTCILSSLSNMSFSMHGPLCRQSWGTPLTDQYRTPML